MLQPLKHILQQKRIILASGSPQRKQLLQSIGLTFEIIVSDFAEDLDLTVVQRPTPSIHDRYSRTKVPPCLRSTSSW